MKASVQWLALDRLFSLSLFTVVCYFSLILVRCLIIIDCCLPRVCFFLYLLVKGMKNVSVQELVQKIEIFKRLRKEESATSIALVYGVGRSTVYDIKKDDDKIEKHASKMQSSNGNLSVGKTMKSSIFAQLDTVIKQWFFQARSKCVHLSGPFMQKKAIGFCLAFHAKLYSFSMNNKPCYPVVRHFWGKIEFWLCNCTGIQRKVFCHG